MSDDKTKGTWQVISEAIEDGKWDVVFETLFPDVTLEKAASEVLALEFVRSGVPDGCVYRLNGEDGGVAFDVIINVYHASVDDPVTQVLRQLDAFNKFHPRALKLLTKMKEFLVVAHDEPYYWDVYYMIRRSEMGRNTWTEEDEARYREKWIEEATNCLAGKTDDYEFARYYAAELFGSAKSFVESPSAVVDNDASYWGE